MHLGVLKIRPPERMFSVTVVFVYQCVRSESRPFRQVLSVRKAPPDLFGSRTTTNKLSFSHGSGALPVCGISVNCDHPVYSLSSIVASTTAMTGTNQQKNAAGAQANAAGAQPGAQPPGLQAGAQPAAAEQQAPYAGAGQVAPPMMQPDAATAPAALPGEVQTEATTVDANAWPTTTGTGTASSTAASSGAQLYRCGGGREVSATSP